MPDPVSVASYAIPAILSAGGAMMQQSSSRAMAREQMRFQERMSSTAYQRSVKDLEAAGLNPALAYGHPASSPGGAMGDAQDVLGKGVASAMAAKRMAADLQAIEQQNRLTAQKTAESVAQQGLNQAQTRLAIENELLTKQRKDFEAVLQPYKITEQGLSNLYQMYVNKSAKAQGEYDERFGVLARGVKDATGAAGNIFSMFGNSAKIAKDMFEMALPRPRSGGITINVPKR